MKRLTLAVAVAATLVAAPALAVSTSSAWLGPINVTLYDLDTSDLISPTITFSGQASAYANAYQTTPLDSQTQQNYSTTPWAPVAALASTALASSQASVTGSSALDANGATLTASGTAINPVSSNPDDYASYSASVASRYGYDYGFTLSAKTLVSFSFASTISGSLQAPVTSKDYASASASTSISINGPGASGSGSQQGSDMLSQTITGYGPQSFYEKSTLGVTFSNLTSGDLSGNLNTSASATGIAYAVPEPEIYAMLLAGLGLMGTIARRRRNAQA